MFAIYHYLVDSYTYLINEKDDPRFRGYFYLSSPFPILGLILFYNYFSLKLGPQLMKPRKPFNLRGFMIFYNSTQIIVNGFVFFEVMRRVYIPGRYNLICELPDYSEEITYGSVPYSYLAYFWIKIYDLVDTIIMVLRKKEDQISFLHVYHHSIMIVTTYIGTKYVAGGQLTSVGIINCFVHVVMYFYYLLTAVSPEYRKPIWWKKHLTQLQMVQFLIMAFHSGIVLINPHCAYPKLLIISFLLQDVFITMLFWNFYKKNYTINKKLD